MKRNVIIKITAFVLVCVFTVALASCNGINYDNPTKISFKAALNYEYLKSLDGTPVTINGYMSTAETPLDGSYIYLMNLPYQSCPFCIPNTNELANTMAIYAQKGKKLSYTEQAIKVTGILEVSSSKTEYFTDFYGYQFNFKIVDAYYEVIDGDEFGETSLFNKLAEKGISEKLNAMYEYLNFVTYWYTYTTTFEGGEDYLYPSDAIYFITEDGAKFNYGYQTGYFDNLRNSVKDISETELQNIIDLIDEAEDLSNDAIFALQKGLNNTSVYKPVVKYSDIFKDSRTQYEYNSSELQDRYNTAFSNYIAAFEY